MTTRFHIFTFTRALPLIADSLLLVVALLLLTSLAQAQQPFQDAKGEGSIFIQDGGFAQINVADPSIRIGFLRNVSKEKWFYGFNASAKLTGSQAGLITKNNLVPDAQGGFVIGRNDPAGRNFDPTKISMTPELLAALKRIVAKKHPGAVLPIPGPKTTLLEYIQKLNEDNLLENGKDLASNPEVYKYLPNFSRIFFQAGYGFKQYTLFEGTRAFDAQVYKKNFHSPSAQLTYFRQLTGRKLFGASIGIQRSNNSTDLTEIEVRDFTTETSGATTREVTRVRKALRGAFREHTRTFLNTDFVWFPSMFESRVGFNVFTRSGLSGAQKGFRPGVGLFLSEKGSPTRVVGGLNFFFDEKGKANLSLVAGYNF